MATTNSVVAAAETETEEEDTATEDTAELVDLAVRASSYRPEIAASIAGKSKREVLEMALDGVVTDMDSRNDDYLMAAFDMASEKQTEATEIRETFRGSSFEVGGGTPPTTGRARTVLTLRKQLRGNKIMASIQTSAQRYPARIRQRRDYTRRSLDHRAEP